MNKHYTDTEIAEWPDRHKRCLTCQAILPLERFSKDSRSLFGHQNRCRGCNKRPGNIGHTPFTGEEESLWADGHRGCLACREVKPFAEFHKFKKMRWGVNNICKNCRIVTSKAAWTKKKASIVIPLYEGAKGRAAAKGVPFAITIDDIVVPEVCPVFGTKFVHNSWYAPTLDRVVPALGYVPGNIVVISKRANAIKNNATAAELRLVADYIDRYTA